MTSVKAAVFSPGGKWRKGYSPEYKDDWCAHRFADWKIACWRFAKSHPASKDGWKVVGLVAAMPPEEEGHLNQLALYLEIRMRGSELHANDSLLVSMPPLNGSGPLKWWLIEHWRACSRRAVYQPEPGGKGIRDQLKGLVHEVAECQQDRHSDSSPQEKSQNSTETTPPKDSLISTSKSRKPPMAATTNAPEA